MNCPICNSYKFKKNLETMEKICLKCGFRNRFYEVTIYDEASKVDYSKVKRKLWKK